MSLISRKIMFIWISLKCLCWKLHLETNKAQKLQCRVLQQNSFLFGFKNWRVYVDPHVRCSSCNDSHSGFNGRAVQIGQLLCCDCAKLVYCYHPNFILLWIFRSLLNTCFHNSNVKQAQNSQEERQCRWHNSYHHIVYIRTHGAHDLLANLFYLWVDAQVTI